jgi:hypothetical protein
MSTLDVTNEHIAGLLERIATLLEHQDANPFRVRAYRAGAQQVRAAAESLAVVVATEGREALEQRPAIGAGLAATIAEFVQTGRCRLLERLQGEVMPEDVLRRVPGIGEALAARIVAQLDIQTLEELERAAHDGQLVTVKGFGARRVEAVRMALAGMLRHGAWREGRHASVSKDKAATRESMQPSVALLLDVDQEYRRRAVADELKKIAPRRFNPEHEAWLPLLHTTRDAWTFTALYSNTARAHELGATHDWVVVYSQHQSQEEEKQYTVVTAQHGALAGRRVVRGREPECRRYYATAHVQ